MKKTDFLSLLLIALLAGACGKEEEVSQEPEGVIVRVSAYDAFGSLTDEYGERCFAGKMPEDYQVRVTLFLYRKDAGNDHLVSREVAFLDDPRKEACFRLDTKPKGDYLAIATADLVRKQADGALEYFNQVDVRQYAPELTVRNLHSEGCYSAFGYAHSRRFSVLEEQANFEVGIKVKPVGTLVTFYFCGISLESYQENGLWLAAYDHFDIKYHAADETCQRAGVNVSTLQLGIKPSGDRTYRKQVYLMADGKKIHLSWYTPGSSFSYDFGVIEGKHQFMKVDLEAHEIWLSDEFPDWAK